MPSWKKVLVSGSSIEVNHITASGVPTITDSSNLLSISSDGNITQITQDNVNGSSPIYPIQGMGVDGSVTGDAFDVGSDTLQFSSSLDHGFGFEIVGTTNTSSVELITPQALKTDSEVTFAKVTTQELIAPNDSGNDTKIKFGTDNFIDIRAEGGSIIAINASGSTLSNGGVTDNDFNQRSLSFNRSAKDMDIVFRSLNIDSILYIDAFQDQLSIGGDSLVDDNLLTISGTTNFVKGVTASFLPTDTSAIFPDVIVDGGSGKLMKRDINLLIAAATASVSSSIIGTANEVEVTTPNSSNIQIGLPNTVTITNDLIVNDGLTVTNISASGKISASELQVEGDIALGGNLFSFSGFSFIEGVSAIFTGSNVFGNGASPGANDTAGGGIAHQFTGSVVVTGSSVTIEEGNLSLNAGSITATSGTGSFGYLKAETVSSSGDLFASLSNDDTGVADGVVVYDDATGQFFTTSSAGVGVTDYDDLTGIPSLIISGNLSLSEGNAQGEYSLSDGTTTLSPNISTGLLSSDHPTFANLDITTNAQVKGSLSVTGSISGSSHLFASLSLSSGSDDYLGFKTVMYDESTGMFMHTGSYGGGSSAGDYLDLTSIPTGIISGSDFTSNSQGTLNVIQNLSSSVVDLGLQTGDSPTFTNLTLTNDAVIEGNLTVNGSTTTISTTNLAVEDNFILLASGSQNAANTTPNDGGIVVVKNYDGTGTALFYDSSANVWSIASASVDASATDGATSDLNIATIELNENLPDNERKTLMGTNNSTDLSRKGQLYIDVLDDYGVYIYV